MRAEQEEIDPFSAERQRQVVSLIRTQFLKRFESSREAFDQSCQTLMLKLLAFATKNSRSKSEKSRIASHHRKSGDGGECERTATRPAESLGSVAVAGSGRGVAAGAT